MPWMDDNYGIMAPWDSLHFSEEEGEEVDGAGRGEAGRRGLGKGTVIRLGKKLRHLLSEAIPI